MLSPEIEIRSLSPSMGHKEALSRWMGFIQLAAGAKANGPSPLRLIGAGESETWLRHLHGQPCDVPSLGVSLLDDVTLSGYGCMFRHGKMLTEQSQPYQIARSMATNEGLSEEQLIGRERQVMLVDPALLIVGPGYTMWGYWLFDMLPRLAIAQATLGQAVFAECVIPIPYDAPAWVAPLLRWFFDIAPIRLMRYDRAREALYCRRAIIPTHAHHNYFVHPFVGEFYQSIAARVGPKSDLPRRILVSRRHYTAANPGAPHRLIQAQMFEAEAEEHGFTPVSPETLDFETQIALFAQAEAVVGTCGSGMHNTLFSPAGTVVGQVGMPNSHQSRIASLRGHRLAYLIPTARYGDAEMHVDQAGISALLTSVSHLKAGQRGSLKPVSSNECLSLDDIAAGAPGCSAIKLAEDMFAARPDPDFVYGPVDGQALPAFRSNTYIPSAAVYSLRNILIDGPRFDIGALLSHDGVPLICPEIALDPNREAARNQRELTEQAIKDGQRSVTRIPGQSLLLATNGHLGFGHWLVDFLPKLYLCQQAGIDLANIKVLLPSDVPGFGREFLHMAGIADDRILSYSPTDQLVMAEQLVIPHALRWSGRASMMFKAAIDYLREQIASHTKLPASSAGPRLFVKRPDPPAHRLIANRGRLEALALMSGFEVFQPELFSVAEQIATFSAATHVIGEYGSTLHNSIFSGSGLVMGAIHLPLPEAFDALQSGIGERFSQPTGYIFAERRVVGSDTEEVCVDEAAFSTCLRDWF